VGRLAALLLGHTDTEKERGVHGGVERQIEKYSTDGKLDRWHRRFRPLAISSRFGIVFIQFRALTRLLSSRSLDDTVCGQPAAQGYRLVGYPQTAILLEGELDVERT
jgi:hypothetical protein